ncbi:glycosyltransferase [Candidatus Woesearchaeota archaeon]|nr:glycosyltransferase [Candidatus Woesearchaeota archaeon]
MKLGILITGLGVGGAENHLLKVLPKLKIPLFVVSLTNLNDVGKELEKKGIKVYYLGLRKDLINIFLVVLRFRKIIKMEKPTVLDTYLIHANLFGRIFGKLFGIKKIISSVRNDYSDLKFMNFLDKNTSRLVKLYVPNSKSLVPYLKRNGVTKNKIKILPNCIDFEKIKKELNEKFSIKEELSLNKNDKVIVSVARLEKQKNLSCLIKAMKYLDDSFKLLLVGYGSEKDNLVKLTSELKLKERVFFLGKRKDVLNIVNSSDIFVLPSFKEGMSNALLEAMALGKKCVVSDIPQNTVVIEGYDVGISFKVKNDKDLALKIKKIIATKVSNKKLLEFVKNNYDVDFIVNEYKEILKEI